MSEEEKVFCEKDNLKIMETGHGVELNQLYDIVIGFSWETKRETKMAEYTKNCTTVDEMRNAIRNMDEKVREEIDELPNEVPEPVLVLLDKYGKCKSVDNFIFYNSDNISDGIVISDLREDSSDVFMKNLHNIEDSEGDKECIGIDLLRLSKKVESIVVYITSRDDDKTFNTVHDVSITIYNSDTMEALCKYDLPEDNNDNRSRKMVTLKIIDRIHGLWLVQPDGKGGKEHIQEIANKHIYC